MAGRTVTVQLNGKERHLKYDLNALAEIGERLGVKVRLDQLGELGEVPLPLSAPSTILWAGLRHEDPELTEEQVGAWVDLDNLGTVAQSFFELLRSSLSELLRSVDAAALEELLSTGPNSAGSPTAP